MPALAIFVEELTHDLLQRVSAIVAADGDASRADIRELQREVRRLGRRVARRLAGRPGRPPQGVRKCSVRGCPQPHVAKGLCKNHYQQVRYREKKAGVRGGGSRRPAGGRGRG